MVQEDLAEAAQGKTGDLVRVVGHDPVVDSGQVGAVQFSPADHSGGETLRQNVGQDSCATELVDSWASVVCCAWPGVQLLRGLQDRDRDRLAGKHEGE